MLFVREGFGLKQFYVHGKQLSSYVSYAIPFDYIFCRAGSYVHCCSLLFACMRNSEFMLTTSIGYGKQVKTDHTIIPDKLSTFLTEINGVVSRLASVER